MKKIRSGFTLVEVALFLAVTGALFVSIMVGTQNSIWQQRYNDTIQGYTNFLRNVYAEVLNPQSPGDGRSDLAIYGKMISFGQTVGLDGDDLNGKQEVYVYDVVGDVVTQSNKGDASGAIKDSLEVVGANVVIKESSGEDGSVVIPAGIVESYSPSWGAVIEVANGDEAFTGSILIVRHPVSGRISTLKSSQTIEVNDAVKRANSGEYNNIEDLLADNLGSFDAEQVDFCLDPSGLGENSANRRDIRIIENARNSSGVEVIDLDSEDNKCK